MLYHTPDFVIINDLFPKSSVHLLVLPRDPTKQFLHPFEAFEDAEFLARVRGEVEKVKGLAGGELRRLFGRGSRLEGVRRGWEERRDGDGEGGGKKEEGQKENEHEHEHDEEPPPGRDWASEIVAGVHAVPSMAHLHIHVISRDRHSPCMKHRKHYNSFATEFMVPLEAFPLARDDPRRWPGREGYLERGMVCWRCGRGFGRDFKGLKGHLEVEFEGWRKE